MRHISSRETRIFWPNAPPVSRITTLIRCSGKPSSRAQNRRTSWGAWVADQIVISWLGAAHSTTMPRVSIGTAV